MGKSTAYSNDILKLYFNGTPIANIADNAATSPLVNLFIAAHSAEPGVGGDQSTSEVSYTGYARATVARTSGGFTVLTNSVTLVASASFGACTVGSATITHWSVGVAISGASKIGYSGVIGSKQGPFTAIAAGDLITIPGHTLVVDDRVAFYAFDTSILPTGMVSGTVYWVKTVSSNDITISTTQGGSALDITAAGDGIAWRVTPIVVTSAPQVTPLLGTSTPLVTEN